MSDFFNLKEWELAEKKSLIHFLLYLIQLLMFLCELLNARESLKTDLEKVDLYFTGRTC